MSVCCNSKAICSPFGDHAITSARRSPGNVLTTNSTSAFNPRPLSTFATRSFASKCALVSPFAQEQSVGGLWAKWSITFRPFFKITTPSHFGHRYSGPRCAMTASIRLFSKFATSIATTFRRIALLSNLPNRYGYASIYGRAFTPPIEKAAEPHMHHEIYRHQQHDKKIYLNGIMQIFGAKTDYLYQQPFLPLQLRRARKQPRTQPYGISYPNTANIPP